MQSELRQRLAQPERRRLPQALRVPPGRQELVLGRQKIPSVPLYLLMGWIGLLAARPLIERLPSQGVWWLLAGGVLYTVGVLFYAKSDVWRHAHGVWHLFVLGGTAAHFVAVFYYVV